MCGAGIDAQECKHRSQKWKRNSTAINSMAYCLNCKHTFSGKHFPNCGSPPAPTPAQVNKALNRHTWILLGGLFGVLFVTWRYPLLDQDPALEVALFLFFVPIVILIVLAVRKRSVPNLQLLKKTFAWFGGILASLVVLLLINGAFDSRPSSTESSVVTRKSVSHGRGGPHYTIRVSPSWRPRREEEKLPVNGATFSLVHIGQAVTVEVHPGALGLPWFSSVTPR